MSVVEDAQDGDIFALTAVEIADAEEGFIHFSNPQLKARRPLMAPL